MGDAIVKREGAEERLSDKLLSLAQTSEERALAFQALTAFRQSKMIREVASAVAGLSWGKALSPYARAAIARYALETGTDPVRHWLVIGDRLYDTASLWLDIATSQPDYAGYDHAFVHDDDRLPEDERRERKIARARHGIPEGVKGACIVRIHRDGRDRPHIGVNWAGSYRTILAKTGAEGTHKDPIGDENPTKTAFTRAFRRAAKTAWPLPILRRPSGSDEDSIPIQSLDRAEAAISQGREALAAGEEQRDTVVDVSGLKVKQDRNAALTPGGDGSVTMPYSTDGGYTSPMPIGKPGRAPDDEEALAEDRDLAGE